VPSPTERGRTARTDRIRTVRAVRAVRAVRVLRLPVALAVACAGARLAAQPPAPLDRAHAHNDYYHPRPLLDALERGFNSVEADVHLVDGELLVAHHRDSVAAGRTLERLYLEPLRARVRANGGRVHPGRAPLLLLIDIKSDSLATWAALQAVLGRYAELLTTVVGDSVAEGAVLAVV
jgi:hypothetical protein